MPLHVLAFMLQNTEVAFSSFFTEVTLVFQEQKITFLLAQVPLVFAQSTLEFLEFHHALALLSVLLYEMVRILFALTPGDVPGLWFAAVRVNQPARGYGLPFSRCVVTVEIYYLPQVAFDVEYVGKLGESPASVLAQGVHAR